jgi:nucleoside phosphorylase
LEAIGYASSPSGEYFYYLMALQDCIFFQSGVAKTRAAAACQFAIGRWHPAAVVNVGTCGGVAEEIEKIEIIMANRSIPHDCIVRFGESREFPHEPMVTVIDTSWLNLSRVSREFFRGTIATADQDLDDATRRRLPEENRLGGANISGGDPRPLDPRRANNGSGASASPKPSVDGDATVEETALRPRKTEGSELL